MLGTTDSYYWGNRTYKKQKNLAVSSEIKVVGRGIEPLCQDWESCILTIRWTDHFRSYSHYNFVALCGSWGIRTPGTRKAHGSLANCWFQPLTQTSFSVGFVNLQHPFEMRMQRYIDYFVSPNFYIVFLCLSCVFRQENRVKATNWRGQKDKRNRLIYSRREDRKTKETDCFTAEDKIERQKKQIGNARK